MQSEYTVVFVAPSYVIFYPEDHPIELTLIDRNRGALGLRYSTHYIDEGFESPIPRGLYIEAKGPAESLEMAIGGFQGVIRGINSIISTATNASIGDPSVLLAYDSSKNKSRRAFMQRMVSDEIAPPKPMRRVNIAGSVKLFEAIGSNPEQPRLFRAAYQYSFGVAHWALGEETLAAEHLWMAIEALTPIAVRNALTDENTDEETLATKWGVDKRTLDGRFDNRPLYGEIRKRMIFRGDRDLYKKAERASNGLEHGYENLIDVHKLAIAVKNDLALCVRSSIIELSGIQKSNAFGLFDAPWSEVHAGYMIEDVLLGEIVSETDNLALEGERHPMLKGNRKIKRYSRDANGHFNVELEGKMELSLGEGVLFYPKSYEVRAR